MRSGSADDRNETRSPDERGEFPRMGPLTEMPSGSFVSGSARTGSKALTKLLVVALVPSWAVPSTGRDGPPRRPSSARFNRRRSDSFLSSIASAGDASSERVAAERGVWIAGIASARDEADGATKAEAGHDDRSAAKAAAAATEQIMFGGCVQDIVPLFGWQLPVVLMTNGIVGKGCGEVW
mmetsp:Transcript_8462/g.20709  ORF Transcript_8462/g.20709 Transcript_8462/m.20709 type:complete len:181 (-) Transcript_8462:29-571(-)